ncbi:hypothetical protein [Ralstonia pseudosolanacearum]|uniref:hypothetical protein n=1 Tax=Ralstonia pseudosolanacearum TaxID=1310165 RepID=UPI003AB0FE48
MWSDDFLMIIRVLLIAMLGMAVWQWGEPQIVVPYGCFGGGPGWPDIQLNAIRLHAKAIALISVTLLVAEVSLRVLLCIRHERARKAGPVPQLFD